MSVLTAVPLLSDGTLPPLVLLVRWLGEVRAAGVTGVRLAELPPGNGCLPDVLRLGGITHLELERPVLDVPFRWEGCGGAQLLVAAAGAAVDGELPLHHGALPCRRRARGDEGLAISALIDLARLEDANAVLGQGEGASWPHILAAAGVGHPPRLPPLAAHAASGDGSRLGTWNPLPFARQLVASLPMPRGTPPWAVCDGQGARHPVQVVEGPLGRELLTELTLDALACSRLTPVMDPVAGGHWEVSRTVLDNGRVRAEFDPLGQLVRLCCDSRFCALSGPALHPLLDGLPLAASATTTVLEEGPVRARVAVSRVGRQGALHLIYTLHAHEDVLRISASWDGSDELVLDHPTTHRGGLLHLGAEPARWSLPQSADLVQPGGAVQRGVRWAALGEEAGQYLALAAPRALALSAEAGHLRVHLERAASYALTTGDHGFAGRGLARTALALAVPGRSFTGEGDLAGAFRLGGSEQLVAWWASRPPGWGGELLLAESEGRRARATLFLGPAAREAWRVDAGGATRDPLPATPEGDGFELDAGAHEIVIVRWR
jgi:hypothetical protein